MDIRDNKLLNKGMPSPILRIKVTAKLKANLFSSMIFPGDFLDELFATKTEDHELLFRLLQKLKLCGGNALRNFLRTLSMSGQEDVVKELSEQWKQEEDATRTKGNEGNSLPLISGQRSLPRMPQPEAGRIESAAREHSASQLPCNTTAAPIIDLTSGQYFGSLKLMNTKFRPLLVVDTKWRSFLKETHRGLRSSDIPEDFLMVVGSAAEVALIARVFKYDTERFTVVNTEMDCMWTFASIDTPDVLQRMAVNVPGQPGFVKLRGKECLQHVLKESRLSQMTSKMVQPNGPPLVDANGFLFASAVRKYTRTFLNFGARRFSDDDHFTKMVVAQAFGFDIRDVTVKQGTIIDGPSSCTFVEVQLRNGPSYMFSVDNVACFCTPWPPEAEDWATRQRKWPKPEDVKKIRSCKCHLVPKPSPARNAAAPDDTEWRWSFSWAEVQLVQLYTTPRQLAYLVFKSVFYRHIKGVEYRDKKLPSYAIKTTMLWECEETDESDWEPSKLVLRVASLCVRLRGYLEKGRLPHYFIPEINILQSFSPPHRQRIAEILGRVSLEKPATVAHLFDLDTDNLVEHTEKILTGLSTPIVQWMLRQGLHLSYGKFLGTENPAGPAGGLFGIIDPSIMTDLSALVSALEGLERSSDCTLL